MRRFPTIVIGAGPAGLTAAYELDKHGVPSLVLERESCVGGIARTEIYKGYRFDIGGHRFFTKVERVREIWYELLGDDMIRVPRLSRIYYNGRYFNYPLDPLNALTNLGIINSLQVIWSYLQSQLSPLPQEKSFEDWVINRFGQRLYETFFKTYTEKVWGIPCDQIQADWAAQRIQGLSLKKAILDALFSINNSKTLIKEFDYPVLGPGMMWERCQQVLNRSSSSVQLETPVVCLEHSNSRITRIVARRAGEIIDLEADQVLSTMPISVLIKQLNPPPPIEVNQAAQGLNYRDFLIVALIIDQADVFPDNWIYIHSSCFKVGRIQNFKNWSPAMVPDLGKTCLGMEYFCSEGDQIWGMSDVELLDLASKELAGLQLVSQQVTIEDGVVIRQRKAYPVYDGEYHQHLAVIREYLSGFENLYTIGRNGMHRYNNQDHSMLTGLMAACNILGADYDLWDVNTDQTYHEEFSTSLSTSYSSSGSRVNTRKKSPSHGE